MKPAKSAASVAELRQAFKQGKLDLIQHFLRARPTVTASANLLRQLARDRKSVV